MKLRLLFSMLFSAVAFFGFSQSIGIIGSATPDGWNSDVDMVQDATDPNLWTIDIVLAVGECKFRQDDAWATNWGNKDFPSGTGEQDGANIPIPFAGRYIVSLNASTGAYSFAGKSDVGIIGTATPNGWDSDIDMVQDPTDPNLYGMRFVTTGGDLKFRQDDAWTINWGSVEFPIGVGIQGGPNIPVPAGKYDISFNKGSGDYVFTEIIEFGAIGVIGPATPGGWDTDTDLTKNQGSTDNWSATLDLKAGEIKFRANDAWTLNWGGETFPTDTGILNGPNIVVPDSGKYLVTFNTNTFIYKFFPVGNYSSIGIIGDATPGGWDTETPMQQDAGDKSLWRLRIILTDGEAKFRANNAWTINWGAGDFPTGFGEQDGANIPIPAGEYKITFNSTTGEYNFEQIFVYNTVGLVGPSTPLASWDTDVDMTKDATDESFWFINSIDLTDGFVKFRAEDAWTVNWGLAQWPSGIGTQDGPNIPVTGGTYRVTLNSASGEYGFTSPISTLDLLKSDALAFSPNPALDFVNIEVKAAELQGDATLLVFNSLGQRVLSQQVNLQNRTRVDVSTLPSGNYLVHISNGRFIVGKQLTVVK